MDVYLQHKLVNISGASYPHKVYLDYILNANSLEQATNTEGFNQDIAGLFSRFDVKGDLTPNQGFKQRLNDFIKGKTVEFEGTPRLQLFTCERLLKNGVPLELKMYPSSSDFVPMKETKDRYSMNIVDCTLRVCFVELNPEILEANDKVMADLNCYKYNRIF